MIGLLALGDRHRPDFDRAARAQLSGVDYVIDGALEGLEEHEVAALSRKLGAYPLRVVAYEKSWEISRDHLLPYLASASERLYQGGASLNVLMCAGAFPLLPMPRPVLYPWMAVSAVVKTLVCGETIGLILPNPSQCPYAVAQWKKQGIEAFSAWAPPGDTQRLYAAVRELGEGPGVFVLDCLGFDDDALQIVRGVTQKPVVSALRATLAVAFQGVRGLFPLGMTSCP